MAVKQVTCPFNFRMEPEYRGMIETIGFRYGTRNMTEVIKRLIQKEYYSTLINPTKTTKEGN